MNNFCTIRLCKYDFCYKFLRLTEKLLMKTRFYAHCSFKYRTFFGLCKENPVLQWQGKQLHALFIFLFQFDFNIELISFLARTKTTSSGYLKCSAPSLHFAQVVALFMKFEHHKMHNFHLIELSNFDRVIFTWKLIFFT